MSRQAAATCVMSSVDRRVVGQQMDMEDVVAALHERSGLPVVGAFAFGDSPQLQDELLHFVRMGTKRATAAAAEDALERRAPEPGLHWGLLDGRGVAHFVAQTVQVTRGRLTDVTPAFAWDEGEYDRTRESWLDAHRSFFGREGFAEPDELDVLFERFRIVWPEADETVWLADGVRELRWDERHWLRDRYRRRRGTTQRASAGRVHDVTTLPGLVCERGGDRVGVLTFRPDPGRTAECVTLEAFSGDAGVVAALTAGAVELGRRAAWTRMWLAVADDDAVDVDVCRLAGWEAGSRRHVRRDVQPASPRAHGRPRGHADMELRIHPSPGG